MVLNEIKTKLEEIDKRVYYGIVDTEDVKHTAWNYIVFNRAALKNSANKTGYSDTYEVHIVRENFVPEGIDTEVIAKMLEIDGMRLAGQDGVFDYALKPSTNMIVEMLTLHFVRARKNV